MYQEIKRACVYAHYDQDNQIDDYVYYSLNQLLNISEKLIFVTVSNIAEEDVIRLKLLNIAVIIRENIGYDFYSYKVGLDSIEISNYNEIILCNDSVYGPLFSLSKVFNDMQKIKCDFWGITASQSISNHIQSYFVVYKSKVINSFIFKNFWSNLRVLNNKHQIIIEYEVGLSRVLYENNFLSSSYITNIRYKVSKLQRLMELLTKLIGKPVKVINFFKNPKKYFSAINRKNSNPSLEQWEEFLTKNSLPFLKSSLFKGEDSKEKILSVQKILNKVSSYPVSLILNHNNRITNKQRI